MSKKARAKRVRLAGKPSQNGDLDFWPPAYGRAAMGRMDEIRALISAGKYPNSRTIAREVAWSVRTVKRDLTLMQNRFKLPMEFGKERMAVHEAGAVLPEYPNDGKGGCGP